MTERDLPYPNKPVGVGGWLMFYIWVVCIILPFIFVVKILEFLREQDVVENADWFNYFLETVPYTSAFFVFCHLCMVVFLYASNKKVTRYIVVLLIWLSGPLLNASLLAFCVVTMPPEAGEYFLAMRIPPSIFNLVWSVIWTLYFLRSKRVANTYWRDERAIKKSVA
ncbi:DUF2569 family protein [Vreelandella boliviensis]|uniref:DUF2569 family protein n=1 Tax=Vreelandella boliviensis TaxID=223527 RepID=UPI001B8D64EF|nr:DUF2569 family protein [Halomonas boliviensis]MBS3670707.1 DUF2569 family protein [Halomonas boliviensis]